MNILVILSNCDSVLGSTQAIYIIGSFLHTVSPTNQA